MQVWLSCLNSLILFFNFDQRRAQLKYEEVRIRLFLADLRGFGRALIQPVNLDLSDVYIIL